MGSLAWCLTWLLAFAMPHGAVGSVPNPPECAVSITGTLTALSAAAKRITWASDGCLPGWFSGFGVGIDATAPVRTYEPQAFCSEQVSAAIKNFAKAANFMSSAAFVCGDVDSGCAQQVFSSMTNVAAIAEYVSFGAFWCQSDRFWCAGSVADVAVSIVLLAQNIMTGLELCSGIEYVPPVPAGFESGLEPEGPEPEAEGAAESGAGYENTLGSSFFPGMQIGHKASESPVDSMGLGAERRLRAANVSFVEHSVLEAALGQKEELRSSMETFRAQLLQVLRKVEFTHALRGEAVPEPFRTLESRLNNATAEAKALASAPDASARAQERLRDVLAKLEDAQDVMSMANATGSQGSDARSSQPVSANELVIV